jgi:hypothetical protein
VNRVFKYLHAEQNLFKIMKAPPLNQYLRL